MPAFGELLARVAKAARAEGISSIGWHWDISDWNENAPNATQWWTVRCGQWAGGANDGRAALEALCRAMNIPTE
jgi:hypothetical protein